MRPSNRTAIIEAAHRVAERVGGADFSYESTASEAGLTKAGVLYHFPSREDLVLAVVDYVARSWESAMTEALGRPLAEATPAQRIRAYVEVAAGDEVSRADVAVYADALCRPEHVGPWNEVFSRWFDLEQCSPEQRARLMTARFAADGLWVAKATGAMPPPPDDHDGLDRAPALAHRRGPDGCRRDPMSRWTMLAVAIVSEVVGTLSLRAALDHSAWFVLVAVGYLAAFALLAAVLAAGMPVGVAYGIWAASGVALTAVLASWVFDDPFTLPMGLGIVLVIIGVLLVELGSHAPARDPQEVPR